MRISMRDNHNLDVDINAQTKFGKILSICLKILSRNKILTRAITNMWKIMRDNPNLNPVDIKIW